MSDIFITDGGDILDTLETGIDYLGKIVKNNILNQTMTDLYSPNFGTELTRLPSTNLSKQKEVEAQIILSLEDVEKHIKEEQNIYPSPDEREMLETIKLYDLRKEGTGKASRWIAEVRVINVVGEEKDVEISPN